MEQTFNNKQKLILLLKIFIPILITQLGLYSMNFFDTTMSGKAGANDLAGVAIGASLWVPIFTGINGILMAVTPTVAQLSGSGKIKDIPLSVIQAIYLSLLISIIILVIGMIAIDPILNQMKLTKEVRTISKHYLIGLGFGIIPLFIYTVLRCFIDALGHTRVTMMITLLSLPINIFFNYVLIFGKWGFPRLGGIGTGYATTITYWVILIVTLLIVIKAKPFNSYQLFRNYYSIQIKYWKDLLKIGVPIGFAVFFETSIFSAVTLLMSEYNTITIASHQAAMNFASFLYMIPLSISMALTIVIGFEVGAQRYLDAKAYSFLGISFAILLAFCTSIFLYNFKIDVASFYTNDPRVLELTAQFLLYAILFQMSDAIGAPIQGALRGYKDVNATFIMAFISYWLIGLPTGILLAKFTVLEAFGYWVGLIIGLAVGAVTLFWRLRYIQTKKFKQDAEISIA
ncbi:MATE family efflux transporter [Calidifontibacillus erzurumensis]|uniref:MATE family efflux transporter n=1 Tax=Calidifontibacillus erzurumensis TaxID=2741433 RepID=UPI0035B54C02